MKSTFLFTITFLFLFGSQKVYGMSADIFDESIFYFHQKYENEEDTIKKVSGSVITKPAPIYNRGNFGVIEQSPLYIGGEKARLKFLKGNLVYPKEAKEKGIEGNVYVSFIVNEDGNVEQVELLHGIGGGCDEEAVRVAKMMPRWYPGKKDGKEVGFPCFMRIKFTLPDEKGESSEPIKDEVFVMAEQPPQYPGGKEALSKFIQENLTYPIEAKEKRIEGTVYIAVTIEKDGSIDDISLARGIGGGCDVEAARLVLKMPKWKPGKVKGKEVRSLYMMPIKFDLATERKKDREKEKQEKKKQKEHKKSLDKK